MDELELQDKKYYKLGNYRIYPDRKIILTCYNSTSDIQASHWEGCYQDSLINFDSTALVFYGNSFDFKEHFDSLIDYNTLKVLHYDIEKNHARTMCKDKNSIYNNGLTGDKIDISDYKCINDWIYLDNEDDIFFMTQEGIFSKMNIYDEKPHLSDIEFLPDNYFFNKDGLNTFKRQYNYKDERNIWFNSVPVRIEENNGEKITPTVRRHYFIYGSNVYLRQIGEGYKKQESRRLFMDVTHLKEFILSENFYQSYILSDGKDTYIFPEKIQDKINVSSLSRWIQLSRDFQRFTYEKKSNTLYFALDNNSVSGDWEAMYGTLISIDRNFWFINFSGYEDDKGNMFSLDKIMIRGINGYEELDIDNYKYIDRDLYTYNGVLYENLCREVEGYKMLDLSNIHPVKHNDIPTNYYSDGKVLFYHDQDYGRQVTQDGTLYPPIIENVDFSSLKVVTQRMLVDKDNIYDGAIVIPIDSLGVKVKVYN